MKTSGDVVSVLLWVCAGLGLWWIWLRQKRVERAEELDAWLNELSGREDGERLREAALLADLERQFHERRGDDDGT